MHHWIIFYHYLVCLPNHLISHDTRLFLPVFASSTSQAMVMPPISESLKRSRKHPTCWESSMSCAMLRDTKPMMDLNIIIGGGGKKNVKGSGLLHWKQRQIEWNGKTNFKGSMSMSALALKTKTRWMKRVHLIHYATLWLSCVCQHSRFYRMPYGGNSCCSQGMASGAK